MKRINPMVKKDIKVQVISTALPGNILFMRRLWQLYFSLPCFCFPSRLPIRLQTYTATIVWLYPHLRVTQIFILGVGKPVRTVRNFGQKSGRPFQITMIPA